ncbi:MAG: DUF1345 domain-containing protein [Massilia sp.]
MKQLQWHRFITSRPNLLVSALIGGAAAFFLPDELTWITRALICWNISVWLFLAIMLRLVITSDHEKVNEKADKEDENAGVVLGVLVIASIASLMAIFSELSQLADAKGIERVGRYVLTVGTLIGSWLLVGVLFCFHYAHKYYRCEQAVKPLKFPDDEKQPDYWDFMYFAFTISVAVQTSDVCVMGSDMRRLVLGHSVLNFFFNLVVLGLSINIAAGLIKP